MRKNYYAIDLIKFICALLVVGIHTYPFMDLNVPLNFYFVQVLGRVAVPFFFVASSFLFFKKIDFSLGMSDETNIHYLKNYLLRILKLYIIWCLIYLVIIILNWIKDGFTFIAVIRLIRDFFFVGGYYHLWFLPAMMVSTAIVYYLYFKIDFKKVIIICLILYIIGMFINVYPDLLSKIPLISNIEHVYLSVFDTSRNGVFFGPIFTLIGVVCAKKRFKTDLNKMFYLSIVCFVLYTLEALMVNRLGFSSDLTSMYFMLIPLLLVSFETIINLDLKPKKYYPLLRHMSTLIYTSHLIFANILWLIPSVNSLMVYLISLVLSIVFSYIVIFYSRKYQFLKRLY